MMIESGPEIRISSQTQIPAVAMQWFETKSSKLILAQDYREGNFSAFYIVRHVSGDSTFAARQVKTYRTNGETEELVYLIDVDASGKKIGHGEMRMAISNTSPYFKDKPFVGYTMTEETAQNNGVGMRRLLIMNMLSRMLYDLPLHSDTLMTDKAIRLWEKLLQDGKAVKYKEGKHDRYRFMEKAG